MIWSESQSVSLKFTSTVVASATEHLPRLRISPPKMRGSVLVAFLLMASLKMAAAPHFRSRTLLLYDVSLHRGLDWFDKSGKHRNKNKIQEVTTKPYYAYAS